MCCVSIPMLRVIFAPSYSSACVLFVVFLALYDFVFVCLSVCLDIIPPYDRLDLNLLLCTLVFFCSSRRRDGRNITSLLVF